MHNVIYFVIMIQETPVENVTIPMPNEYFRHHSVSYRDISLCMRVQLLWPLVLILWEIIYTEFIGHTILSCQRASQSFSPSLACLPRLPLSTLSIVSLAWLLPSTVALDSFHRLPRVIPSINYLLRLISSTASLESFRRLPLLTYFADCLSWLISSTASLDSFRRLPLLTHDSFRRLPLLTHFADCLSWLIPSTAFLDYFGLPRFLPSTASLESFRRLIPSIASLDSFRRLVPSTRVPYNYREPYNYIIFHCYMEPLLPILWSDTYMSIFKTRYHWKVQHYLQYPQPESDIVRPCDKLAKYLEVYVHYNSQMCYGIVNITHITTNKQIWEGHQGVIIYVYA